MTHSFRAARSAADQNRRRRRRERELLQSDLPAMLPLLAQRRLRRLRLPVRRLRGVRAEQLADFGDVCGRFLGGVALPSRGGGRKTLHSRI